MPDESGKHDESVAREADAEAAVISTPTELTPARRPYAPPKLRSLGKVSELTFVKSANGNEGPFPKRNG